MKINNTQILAEGAESKIIKIDNSTLKKIRLPKTYRLKEIDEKIRKFRNKREFKVLKKLYENQINVPKPIEIIDTNNKISFTMEYIKGKILKYVINEKLLLKAFEEIIKIHNLNIIHGDLTTLNMIKKNNNIFIIDFGLSEFSQKFEEKAVDLNLFFTCIKNEHPNLFYLKSKLIDKYSKNTNNGNKIIERLEQIEKRGRNKNKN